MIAKMAGYAFGSNPPYELPPIGTDRQFRSFPETKIRSGSQQATSLATRCSSKLITFK
jgi:hypothetical protein